MNKIFPFKIILILMLMQLAVPMWLSAQSSTENMYNPITTAVPFLTITPDSRHGAMGDVGVATSADANAQYWNPSKLAFIDQQFGVAISFTPWLKQLFNDMNLAYLTGYLKLKNNQTLGASLRYFSIGEIQLTDQSGTNLASVKPNEFALDVSYSRKLSETFSGSVALRYIRSDLSGGIGSDMYVPGNAFASDVSFYYHKDLNTENNRKSFAAGINLSNIGSRISYDNGSHKELLPANMKLGATYTTEINTANSFAFSLDFNKLMVPTPHPGLAVNDPDKNPISGIFSSFSDAPGGMSEELREIKISAGVEYWYSQKFAVRTGYFNESQYKGNRKFFSAGLGVKMNICSVDVAYLIPVNQNNPLANTMRFSLLFDLGKFRKDKAVKEETVPVEPTVPSVK